MSNWKRKKSIWVGLGTLVSSFLLLWIGMEYVVDQEVTLRNILAYLVFSLIVGTIAGIFYDKAKIAFYVYMVGLIYGFIDMFRAFFDEMTGWGDLIGILSLMIWTFLGLSVGLICQAVYALVHRRRIKTRDDYKS